MLSEGEMLEESGRRVPELRATGAVHVAGRRHQPEGGQEIEGGRRRGRSTQVRCFGTSGELVHGAASGAAMPQPLFPACAAVTAVRAARASPDGAPQPRVRSGAMDLHTGEPARP